MNNSTYKPLSVHDFTSDKLSFNGIGVTGSVSPNTTQNIDLVLTDDNLITGVVMNAQNAYFNDYVSMQVVANNAALAASLGVPVGTVLNQFATGWRMRSDQQLQLELALPYPAKILATMTLRAVYTCINSNALATAVSVNINYLLHLVHV